MLKRFHKACLKYPAWKKRHNAHFKPWLFPEQMPSVRLDVTMVSSINRSRSGRMISIFTIILVNSALGMAGFKVVLACD